MHSTHSPEARIQESEINTPQRSRTGADAFWGLLFILLLCLLSGAVPSGLLAATPEPPATPGSYVVDLARIINDDLEGRLNAHLRELEQKTTAQVVVLTVQSLDGEDIGTFSLRIAEKWRLGQKGKDNGVLMCVAVKDRKYRFEIGYGLESVLPDSMVGSIGRQYLVPYFRKGYYSGGIENATLAVVRQIAGSQGVRITGMPDARTPSAEGGGQKGMLGVIIGAGLIIAVLYLFIRHPRLLLLLLLSSSAARGRSGWHSGGGFGGGDGLGSSGGFGGGGGGEFGGGGASGSW